MNANVKGTLYVKQDRINDRIDDFAKYFLNLEKNKETITREDFKDFVRSVHLIINSELNEKGVERKWKESSQKSEKPNNACSQGFTKGHTSFARMLMTKLQQWR